MGNTGRLGHQCSAQHAKPRPPLTLGLLDRFYRMTSPKLHDIDDGHLSDLLNRSGVSLLLVTSSWDGEGIIMRALLERLSGRYRSVVFYTADVDTCPVICKVFNVTNPPGLLFLQDGELIDRRQGAVGGTTIVELIETNS